MESSEPEMDVQRVTVAPIFPEWNALLHGARTRQEVFRAHDEEDGYVHMNLEFTGGTLRRISVLEAPAAL